MENHEQAKKLELSIEEEGKEESILETVQKGLAEKEEFVAKQLLRLGDELNWVTRFTQHLRHQYSDQILFSYESEILAKYCQRSK